MAQDTTYSLQIPSGYEPKMGILETEKAIKALKDYFEKALSEELSLVRVSAPLFLFPETGMNDNLNGVERPVSFDILNQQGRVAEVVQSLAKWKRYALQRYGIPSGSGLYTDMNAIRRDEVTDNLHSIYVDQWDWERVILRENRTTAYLEETVNKIYGAFLKTQDFITKLYPFLDSYLPRKITFISSQELENIYPDLRPPQRECEAAKKFGAIFVTQIGGRLKSGERHDGRAPDYDDWDLNGDMVFYYPVLDRAFEVSSMGIRVDEKSLLRQLEASGNLSRASLPFQSSLLKGELPLSIGGGIGQSRLCMFFLNKAHIGEVQASVWPDEMMKKCEDAKIALL